MKRYLAIFGAMILAGAASAARAQSPPPQDDRQTQQQQADDDSAPQSDQNEVDQMQIQDRAADEQANQQELQKQQQDVAAQPGVARVSWIRGDVTTQRGDTSEWIAAIVNTPISQGDRVATGERSRAELQLDFADTLRLSDRVTVKIATLTRSEILLQLGQGLATYSVNRGAEANTEIDTPNASIRPLGEGEYRIIVNSDAETQVTIVRGSAEVSTPQGSTRVDAGQLITIAGTDNPQYRVGQAPPRDDWDNWNSERNRTSKNANSWQNTNRYYTGSQDLDPYGHWQTVPDYGRVWVPNVASGWAPYRAGRWVWQPYFGWTWVSYEPWGWAPYHYGRWLPYGAGWAWWPGPVAVYPTYYPVWAPAYVSFFGFGGVGVGVSFGFGFGFGHVGWLPCGPGDRYHPWYGRSGGTFASVHNTTINNFHGGWAPLHGGHGFSNVHEAFRNDHVRAGMSSMESGSFGHGTVPAHQTALSSGEFRNASMVSGKMPVAPGRGSYSASTREVNPSTVRNATSSSQHFYSAPRNTSRTTARSSRPSGPTTSNPHNGYSTSTRPAQPNNNANRAAQPNTQTRAADRGAPSASSRHGWHTFSPPSSSSANRQTPSAQTGGRGPTGYPNGRGGYGAPNAAPRPYQPPNAQSGGRGPTGYPNGRGAYGAPNGAGRPYQPPNSASRGGYPGSASRPPLNMRQPIVTPRNGGSNGSGASRGGSSGSRGGGGGGGGGSHSGGGGGSHKH